jgi:hypothetical protein
MTLLLALRQDMLVQRTAETELRLTAAGLCSSTAANATTPVMTMSSTISLQQVCHPYTLTIDQPWLIG